MHQIQIEIEETDRKGRRSTRVLQSTLPENYNELTRKQLLRCIRIMFRIEDRWLCERLLLRELMTISRVEFEALPAWVIHEFGKHIRWLTESNTLTLQLQPFLRLPVRHAWQKLHGPGELFVNLSFAEFVVAEKFFMRYCRQAKAADLHQLVATLYRPQRWLHLVRKALGNYAGDQRVTFNEHLVAGRARVVAGISDEALLAVLTWYRGCREAIERLYPDVFSDGESDEPKPLNPGWEPVLRGMAGGKFGDYDKTKLINVHIVLREMNEQIRRAEEAQRKFEMNK